MCGTFMQILGQGASLYLLDLFIRPAFGGGVIVDMFLFLIKGIVTFYVYKWFQCSTTGIIRNPLHGTTFWMALIGGFVGMLTLMITGMLVNEQRSTGPVDELIKYGIEAVVLNLVYGISSNMVASMAANNLVGGY